MTAGGYVVGWLWLAAVIGSLLWGAGRLRRRYAPAFSGVAAGLADFVVALGALLLVCELLGTVGEFRRLPVLAVAVIVGVAGGLALGRSERPRPRSPRTRVPAGQAIPAAIAVACVAIGQLPGTLAALRGGISNFDSLEYHLTKPARWLQEHSLSGIHQIFPGSLFPYYPSNSELVHGVGMLAFSSDVLSPVVNLGFIALAFLAAWSIGDTRGAGPAAVAALASVLSALHFAQAGGGTAVNDLPQAAFILVAVALAAHARGGVGELLFVGLAAGLALGTKPTASIAAVCVVGGAVLTGPAGGRSRAAVTGALGLLAGGGFWYLRNLAWIGTPIPGTDLGPFRTPVAEQLNDSTFVDAARASGDPLGLLAGGLHRQLGPAWAVLAALVVAGLVLSLLGRSRPAWERGASLAALATLLAWPVTPFTYIVDFAIRYAVAALALGVVLLAITPRLTVGRLRWLVPWMLAAIALVELVHVAPFDRPYAGAAIAGGLVALAAVGATLLTPRDRRLALAAGAVAVAAVLVSIPVATAYDRNRYSQARYAYSGPAAASLKRVYQWARGVDHARIGVEGGEIQLPLYGRRLDNHVQYIGVARPDGGFGRIGSCRRWRTAVNAGRYRYVVTVPWGLESDSPPLPSPQGAWTAGDPAARVELDAGDGIKIFRIVGKLNPDACAP